MSEEKSDDSGVVDLFCGAGGLSHGFQKAGFNILLGIDKEENFLKAFDNSHPEAEAVNADLSEKSIEEITEEAGIGEDEVDVVIGGPPCQGFSTVGDRKQSDDRNKLVRSFADSLDKLKPEIFLMENVTGLKSMKDEHGNNVINELEKMFNQHGYQIKYKVLKASEYGVPQDRERLFIIGRKEGIEEFEWPQSTHTNKNSIQAHSGEKETILTVREALSDIPDLTAGEKKTQYEREPSNKYQKELRQDSDEVLNHKTPDHSETVRERLRNIPQGGNHGDLPEDLQLNSGYGNIYGRLDEEKTADTITGNFGCVSAPGRFIHPTDDRALTVREGARLQSFPDHYEFFGSQSDQYKQVGNAVPPILAEKLAEKIREII